MKNGSLGDLYLGAPMGKSHILLVSNQFGFRVRQPLILHLKSKPIQDIISINLSNPLCFLKKSWRICNANDFNYMSN